MSPPVRWDPYVEYIGRIPPKRLEDLVVACRLCGHLGTLENVRPWPGMGIWTGETRCCGNTQEPRKEAS